MFSWVIVNNMKHTKETLETKRKNDEMIVISKDNKIIKVKP